ncbi:helicase-related protein [Blautia sp.]|uniref:helicase-related protein n=1 Tax=Blautia sp. TaxID=1955243 RepID=UPI002F429D45
MARKLQLVSQLADQTAHDVTQGVDNWKDYLDSASRLYKYKFEDQLLIYAQRPDATACASMELWNEKMRRWVKAGSKGIALIHENENGRPRLEYVFDVSDTRPVRGARMPYLWEMREEHHPAVVAALEKQYGVGSLQDLGSRLMETASGIVEEAYPEYLRDLAYDAEGSFLEEMDDLNREVCFRDTLTASVQYTLLTRCGLDASDYLDDDDLRGITEFSTPAALHHLGDAASTISMGILQEIGRTIRNFDREQINEQQKKKEKPLENAADIGYTKDTRNFNTLKREIKERSIQNGRADIQEEWGLSDTGSGHGRGGRSGGNPVREIRASEADLPEGTPPRDVHLHAADGEAYAAPETDRRTGTGADRPDGSRNDEAERGGRGYEGARPDGLGAGGQQLHGTGRGSGAEGDRLPVSPEEDGQKKTNGQLDTDRQETAGEEPAVSASGEKEIKEPQYFQFSLFPTVEEQAGRIAEAQEKDRQAKKAAHTTDRTAPQVTDAVIGRALTVGGNEKNSILRIAAFYQKDPDVGQAAAFLAEEYKTGGKGLSIGGRDYAMWFDQDGIRIAQGHTANTPGSTLVSWEKAAEMVSGLLEEGRYAAQETLDSARQNEYRELAEKLWYLRQDLSDEGKEMDALPFLSELYDTYHGFPDCTEKLAECLADPETRKRLMYEVDGFAREYDGNHNLLRFHFHEPFGLAARISLLSPEPKKFTALEGFEPARASFITEDEIDRMLTRGSGISEAKMRIYSYFVQGHDAKERTAFLRDEYGTGGHGHTGYNEWHDSKGIKLTRGDEISGFEGYDTVRLNWDKVQKRIGQLIESGRYLTPKEMAYTAQYEKIQLARNIVTFYSCDPNRETDISPYDRSYDEAQKKILTALGDPEKSAAMYEDMAKRFALVQPDERNYHLMQRAMDNMGAYQRGEYSLFTPLSAETLQEQRQKKKEAEKPSAKKEAKPLDELEAAARALAKKQRQKAKEDSNGQLSFDFSANVPEETEAEPDGQEPAERKNIKADASKILEEQGLAVSDEMLDTVLNEAGQEPVNGEALARRTKEALHRDEEEAILSQYDLGYGYLGNGLTVWNRLEEVYGDYKTVAHINADRSVDFRDADLPEIIKEQIRQIADTAEPNISATQDVPVFTEPPKKDAERTEGKATAEENKETLTEKPQEMVQTNQTAALYRETLATLTDVIRQSSFYDYLRDRETDYDSAAAELDSELAYFVEDIADSQPELYEAFHSLPKFREWMVEDILQLTYDDVLIDSRDALLRHAGEPDFPEWAAETPGQEQSVMETAAEEQPVQELKAGHTEEPAPDTAKEPGNTPAEPAEPDLIPNVEEYLNLKSQHSDKLVGVQAGGYYLFYGEDAKTAAAALGTKLETREIPGLGETSVTGGRTWQTILKNLLEHGHSTVIAGPDPEHGETAPYQIIKERDIADYIPLGMQLTIDGRRMEIDSVDYENGHVSLKDLEMQGWFPIFRQEAVPFVRDCVEQEWERAGFVTDVLETAEEKPQTQLSGQETADGELTEEELSRLMSDPEMREAIGLIEDFILEEYNEDSVDIRDPRQVGIAYGVTDKNGFEVQVDVNLLDFSISQTVDGKVVETRQYDSLRELIDMELAFLDYDQLLYLEPHIEDQLEADLNERIMWEQTAGAREGLEPTEPDAFAGWDTPAEQETAEGQDTPAGQEKDRSLETPGRRDRVMEPGMPDRQEEPLEMVEIEGGTIGGDDPLHFSSPRLPYDIVIEKLRTGPERVNFHITDDELGTGGQKTKYQNNVAAIRTLKQIEAENRLATPQEQEVLSNYVGWGGIAQAFDPDNEKWSREHAELKELLTPEEYASAQSTVLNAHYTSPTVIKAMYEAVSRMDFTPGNILEPSCGIGNFFGLVPEGYGKANLYGVELDHLTGRIARQLYQKADIAISGFEDSSHPDDFFDLAVGNVPFGEYKVHDRRYDRQNLLIHDYFLTKSLDKLRPGGIAAFITTKGTMDKLGSKAREELAQKADLLGAIRLPNTAFKANAGTSVTADILFFQKRGSAPEKLPEWVNIGQTEDGVPLNNYFLQHPEMVLGKMAFYENMYGNATETACLPIEGADLKEQLAQAIDHIAPPDRELLHMDAPEPEAGEKVETVPADPDVRNFSFTEKGGKLYFRENSRMKLTEPGKTQAARIRGMIGIRDSARKLIDLQMSGADDETIQAEQTNLNRLYDRFQEKYGILNSAGNRLAFRQDSSYPLLCSLEVLDEEGNLKRKADMFNKRTIQHRKPVTSVDTAVEALGVSIGERACVDLGFMASLMGGTEKIPQIVSDLKGVIFKDPESGPFDMESDGWYKGWQAADEYLSGNVRRKLETARAAAETYPEFAVNVEELEKVQPKDLTAPEINVRIGSPWIDTKYYKQFMFELFQTPYHLQEKKINIVYSDVSGEWSVRGKSEDSRTNTRVWNTYGTKRINAYAILEASLNQRSVQIFDTHYDVDGKETRVLNEKETAIAQQKQESMKEAFQDWIFKDPDRRADLCATYNRMFNSMRPREYDGQHINFIGMNPEIHMERHQRNAVARSLYGGNSLLAHVVGAGKTYEMVATAMESKRLGLCKKSMIVVPNHLTEQWGGDFLALYPGANVLVATKKDFEPKNRKKFCARIATGDFDAVIIGHSQFEKIPISPERQKAIIEEQINEIVDAIAEAKANKDEKFTIKQMERTKKNLTADLKKLHDKKKDDTVYFEELGVDRLFVDEAHSFKNLYMHTKMRNVAGISQTRAQKSSDMFAKCRYMDEITGGRGVVFATGTPVSNSMVELYTMMRYLQYNMLEQGYQDSTGKTRSLKHFDNWAATFGEQVTAVELKPEGTGFRLKTRFARFYNLPELMNLWKEAADIQTADMLKLPVPEAEYITIQTEPSEAQKKMVQGLAERAEKIRKEKIDPSIDNMLKITSDGRKLALDQRIMNPLLPDDPGSKVNACVENVFQIWRESTPSKGTQLIFSDLSTPKGRADQKKETEKEAEGPDDGKEPETGEETVMEASVYEDIRKKLIAKGIPAEEIAFIHDANTENQKAELFAKVRSGQVRVLLGSTQKMGAGTNVQTKLIASHDLDCPWRPADLEQRAGRIVRRGNENSHVKIFRYVTKGTFDAYTWGLVESKQKFIGQIMTSKSPARSIEDVDATALSYAEVKMLATGDQRIKEKMDLDIQVTKLKMLKSNHTAQQYEMQDKVRGYYPNKIKETELLIDCLKADLPLLEAHPVKEDAFTMEVMGTVYTDRKEAGQAIVAACRLMEDPDKDVELGSYRGFPMKLSFDGTKFKVTMKQYLTHTAELSSDVVGNITRINNALEKIPQSLKNHQENLERLHTELESAKEEAERPFPQEEELAEKSARLAELNTVLDNEEKGRGAGQETPEEEPGREESETPERAAGKPSILKSLKEYERPAPVISGREKSQEREVI